MTKRKTVVVKGYFRGNWQWGGHRIKVKGYRRKK